MLTKWIKLKYIVSDIRFSKIEMERFLQLEIYIVYNQIKY